MTKNTKTNVMRLLEESDISYMPHQFKKITTEKYGLVYKTLVTEGKTGENYVFLVPIESELNLKKAAKSVGEKNISMIKEKELFPLTGYVHGGCSPIGMKKDLHTVIDESAFSKEAILFSAGKKDMSVEVNPYALQNLISAKSAEITNDKERTIE